MSNLFERRVKPTPSLRETLKKRVIPNIPNELLLVNKETIKMPGVAFTTDTIELAKLMQDLIIPFHSAAGDTVREGTIPDMTVEEQKAKIERMKTLLKEKIAKETELLEALKELSPAE